MGTILNLLNIKKIEDSDTLILAKGFYVDNLQLTLDRESCIGCDICSKVCPKEAISIIVKNRKPLVSIDENKCVLCGACEPLCPTNAIRMWFNDKESNVLVEKGGFPKPTKKLDFDILACPVKCVDGAEACPRGALKVLDGSIKFEESKCLRCPWCEDACEHQAMKVFPFFLGRISIDKSKCSKDCDVCSKVCPTNAIKMEGGKPTVKERYCVFCNACLNVCGDNAIDVKRYHVFVEKGFSALLSSSLSKLLDTRSSSRLLDTVQRNRLRSIIFESRVA